MKRPSRNTEPPAWPTPAAIRAACEDIQASWSNKDRRRRACYGSGEVELTPLRPGTMDGRSGRRSLQN